jgi:hypothetical protein
VLLSDSNPSNLGNHVSQLVNGNHAILAKVEWSAIVRAHQLIESGDAIIYVAERPRLLSVAPDLDLRITSELSYGNLPAQCGGRFFSASVVGP